MPQTVPVLYRDRDTVVHRRDARVKVLTFGLLFLFAFIAPTADWMLVLLIGGLLLAVLARTPWRWLLVLWAIQVPTFLALILIPGWGALTSGNWAELATVAAEQLRLILAWTGTILVSVSLFSAIDPDDLARGLRGLGLPAVAAFAVGLSYRLLYTTLSEVLQVAEVMRLQGVRLDWRRPIRPIRPIRFVRDALQVSLPVLFIVVRRAPLLMSTMRMRGFATEANLGRLGAADMAFVAVVVAAVAGATLARWGPLPATIGW